MSGIRIRGTRQAAPVEVAVWIVLILFSVSVLYPFWTVVVDSISTPEEIYLSGFRLWPRTASLDAYAEVFRQNSVLTAYINTVIRATAGVGLNLVVCLPAAFALSKRRLPFSGAITLLMIFTMFFSGGMIANYLWIRSIKLYNNRLALVLPGAANAFYIIIARNFFRSLPPELEESAFIDGAGVWTVLIRITMPLSLPLMATVGLWSAVAHWNAWFDALIYTPDQRLIVLQLLIRRLLIQHQTGQLLEIMEQENSLLIEETVSAATLIVSIGPIILIYPFLQKYFVKGIMTGAMKG